MIVEAMTPADRATVLEIAALTGQQVDLDAELAKTWASLQVARAAPGAPASAVLLTWSVADELHVINVATHPNARRRGAARALLSEALAGAIRDRKRLVLLEVRRSNLAAISLYRSLGFSIHLVRRGYYADNSEDAIEMKLCIDPNTGQIALGHDEAEVD
ncbi:MAG: GNAT family N-acetyltransferase [Myxococcales bacterium]|nr:GNAT family N-acetyltransferase [Myxococcales bacterium]